MTCPKSALFLSALGRVMTRPYEDCWVRNDVVFDTIIFQFQLSIHRALGAAEQLRDPGAKGFRFRRVGCTLGIDPLDRGFLSGF